METFSSLLFALGFVVLVVAEQVAGELGWTAANVLVKP